MTFNEYMTRWFEDIMESHSDQPEWIEDMFDALGYEKEDIEEDDDMYSHIMYNFDANDVYEKLFAFGHSQNFVSELPEAEEFVTQMIKETCPWCDSYSFGEDFVEDMAMHITGYTSPLSFFKDLAYGGCISGMIGMLVYNTNCKEIYVENIDDMERFKEELEGDMGGSISNRNQLPHYTFVAWLCYEEFAQRIARTLWEDEF